MSGYIKIAMVKRHATEYAKLIGVDPGSVLDARLPQSSGTTDARRAALRIGLDQGISARLLIDTFHAQNDTRECRTVRRQRWVPEAA